jgi:hypothetical protein
MRTGVPECQIAHSIKRDGAQLLIGDCDCMCRATQYKSALAMLHHYELLKWNTLCLQLGSQSLWRLHDWFIRSNSQSERVCV